jgi:serine-type D-Ala-D-Ala carboxypeptidase (penicillin-binding protein 5/6)
MKRKRSRSPRGIIPMLAFAICLGAAVLYGRPLPALASQPTGSSPEIGAKAANVAWPTFGQSAIGVKGYGALASSGPQKPMPTASVAKLMTALVVLEKKPLKPGEQGPMLTVTKDDLAIYDWYFSRDGSLTAVQEGEKISQYDVLEAVLLASANNMSDMLATWAFGSVENYNDYANKFAQSHGMLNTTIADASGFSPHTVSTADDLVQLGSLALQNPVIAEIVAKREAQVPVAGTIYNVNGLLGRDGINGLKAGSTDQAGGVFVISADRTLSNGQTATVIAAVMDGDNLVQAMLASVPLLDAAVANLKPETVAKKGQVFGSYDVPWSGSKVNVVASRDVSLLTWQGADPKSATSLKSLHGAHSKGAEAGTTRFISGDRTIKVPLELEAGINPPTAWWRISRF